MLANSRRRRSQNEFMAGIYCRVWLVSVSRNVLVPGYVSKIIKCTPRLATFSLSNIEQNIASRRFLIGKTAWHKCQMHAQGSCQTNRLCCETVRKSSAQMESVVDTGESEEGATQMCDRWTPLYFVHHTR